MVDEIEKSESSFGALIPGAPIFVVGVLIWLLTAGLGFLISLPVMFLGSFLMIFKTAVMRHSSSDAKFLSWGLSLVSALVCIWFIY